VGRKWVLTAALMNRTGSDFCSADSNFRCNYMFAAQGFGLDTGGIRKAILKEDPMGV
jgi:hypothetical protein